ncbi:FtsX-like permease family protein [Halopiger djelfimassiliensis]|uniref:FtsX-like permease family protein n=1 Tax=Halopiger djelfimassiliensis TaxID=1293047 RepID=UPI000677DD1D|nr:FtsX-like permease family protein [Halopiger djelfimassiliensis]
MRADADGTRRSRWAGLVGLSTVRLWKRATGTTSGRIAATIGAVAVTIALLVIVTGVALALAGGGVASEDDADVRIVPEETGALSSVDGVESPRLGATNERAATMRSQAGIDHATPVLVEPVRLEPTGSGTDGGDGDPHTVLVVGVVPDEEPRTVGGLSTAELEPGDTHYANGSYDGPRNGEIVLSAAAADRLGATTADELTVSSQRREADEPGSTPTETEPPTVTVTAVETAGTDRETDVSVALVHLSEIQSVAGSDDGELADRVLVWGDPEAAQTAATDAYPAAAVEADRETDPSALFEDGLALATSLLALLVGLTICASFVATTTGMTVDDDRRTLAVLASVGFPTHSRLVLVAVSTLVTTLCGALLGVGLGVLGVRVVNAVANTTVAPGAVAVVHPLFVPYGIAVALVSGLVAVPYPLAVAARTSVLEEVGR